MPLFKVCWSLELFWTKLLRLSKLPLDQDKENYSTSMKWRPTTLIDSFKLCLKLFSIGTKQWETKDRIEFDPKFNWDQMVLRSSDGGTYFWWFLMITHVTQSWTFLIRRQSYERFTSLYLQSCEHKYFLIYLETLVLSNSIHFSLSSLLNT